jgi:uncharacterized protein YukJ
MPIAKYGVLVGRPLHGAPGRGDNAHYQIHVVDHATEYRIAVNVKSKLAPSEVEFFLDEDFQHPITELLRFREPGFYPLGNLPTSGSLDFIRGNLFDRTRMRPLPVNLPGPDDDLNDKVDRIVRSAIGEEEAFVCAFGQRWGPETVRDKIFGFMPGNGIHDIHMNQGNSGSFTNDDGVWQDGGLFFFLPSVGRWTALFLKFQSQSWHTDDRTGHTILIPRPAPVPPPVPPPAPTPVPVPVPVPPVPPPAPAPLPLPGPGPAPVLPGEPDFRVRIIAARVNPHGNDQGHETVTLLNVTDQDQPLAGWSIANRTKAKLPLAGVLKAGQTVLVTMPIDVPLSNDGGLITLLDAAGLKVHGVSYTKAQATRQGWTVTF